MRWLIFCPKMQSKNAPIILANAVISKCKDTLQIFKKGELIWLNLLQNGVAGAGLGLGISGTALALLNGGLSNLLGGGCNGWNTHNCGCYELSQENRISKLESEIALRDANIYNDQKLLELYKYIDGKFEGVNATLGAQAVWNATQTSAINCMTGQINQLFGLTKLVVPNTSVCPGWGNVTITPSTTTTTP